MDTPGPSRKRVLSTENDAVDDDDDRGRPRRRIEVWSAEIQGCLPLSRDECLPSAPVFTADHEDNIFDTSFASSSSAPPSTRPLPRNPSYPNVLSRMPSSSDLLCGPGLSLVRRASSQSLASAYSSSPPSYPELSGKYHLRNTRNTIDSSAEGDNAPPSALCCSAQNTLYFSRGNRIHFKSLLTPTANAEDIGQLCRLPDSIGDLKLIDCGGTGTVDHLALATTKGTVQIWDVVSRKVISQWSTTKGIAAMKWNGPLLTIGAIDKGHIRHYDTRISPSTKMKEQARKMTRHQAKITTLAWNPEGKLLASGDDSGQLYCWDHRKNSKVPLDVGEFFQRRKKMQHSTAVTALSWCPWQVKVLASGDQGGIIRLWNVDPSNANSNAITPGKIQSPSPVTGLHFSPQCKEFISTQGAIPMPETPVNLAGSDNLESPVNLEQQRPSLQNCVAVYSYPGVREVTTLKVSDKPVAGSVLNPSGTKLVVAVPEESKLKIYDAWGKTKELRRQPSFMNSVMIR